MNTPVEIIDFHRHNSRIEHWVDFMTMLDEIADPKMLASKPWSDC